MDDGSRDMDETRAMLHMEHDQGIREIIMTPHFYADRDFPEEFLKRRQRCLTQVREMLAREAWGQELTLYGGAEVYYFPGIAHAASLSDLCIQGTKVLLLELPFRQWDTEIYHDVKQIIQRQKLTVVLAHIERYYPYQKNKQSWKQIFELPLYAQMNATAFLSWRARLTGVKLLRKDYQVILGSDCHNTDSRPPNLGRGREVIKKMMGPAVLEEVDRREKEVLGV
jgi:protein-tyrosine phosphatase